MKKYLLLFLLLPALAWAQVQNWLGLPQSLLFDGQTYQLKWSANPMPGYYKQEFLPAADTLSRFRQMLTVDWLQTPLRPEEVRTLKVRELQQLVQRGGYAQWRESSNDSEAALEFVMLAEDNDGEVMLEYNVYRYRAERQNGKDGVLLLAVSRRAYGEAESARFVDNMQQDESTFYRKVLALPMPTVRLRP
ncbi:MAG: hypothetical protein Q4G28_01735 [Neisseria sp.]|nr:hypothetical protein [Neisseria sp.]